MIGPITLPPMVPNPHTTELENPIKFSYTISPAKERIRGNPLNVKSPNKIRNEILLV